MGSTNETAAGESRDAFARLPALLESPLTVSFLTLAALAFVLWIVFSINVGGYGALASPATLEAELHSSADSPTSWKQGDEAPYCYRWLFRAGVIGLAHVVPGGTTREGFFHVFVAASAASLLLATFLLARYLRATGASPAGARLGQLLFLASFPVLFAYDMPIHTREDFLGYACVALELWLVALDRPLALAQPLALALTGALAANVRETTAIGLLPYLFVAARPRGVRAAVVAPAFATIALVHVLRAPPEAPLRLFLKAGVMFCRAFTSFGIAGAP